ncbi:MAG: type II secretion system protein F [Lachnospiraceae bacterium]|nr:type II secretion system protein F [Lachnospiraceae bacterium]
MRKQERGKTDEGKGPVFGMILKAESMVGIFAYLFYRNMMAFFIMQPMAFYLAWKMKQKSRNIQEQKLGGQFKDGLLALAASLRAGHSAENAFQDAAEELAFLYGPEGRITCEFRRVVDQIGMNIPLEQAVQELAVRCKLSDIRVFAEVFSAARRTGGELGRIILDTVQIIAGRLEVQEEIATMLRGRQYEQKVMKMVPLLLLFYMDLTSPGFFSALYGTFLGRGIMTGCLTVYLIAVALAEKISNIQV